MILISGGSTQIGQGIINKFLTKELNFYFLERKKNLKKNSIFFDIDKNSFDKKKIKKIAPNINFFINIAYSRKAKKRLFNYKIIKTILSLLNKNTILINISSISAFTNSLYGKEKIKIEKEFDIYSGNNIRCGLIYSNFISGFLRKIIDIAETIRVIFIPRIFKNKIFFLTRLEILLRNINKIIKKKHINKKLIIVDARKYNFIEILNKFCKKKILYILVPNWIFMLALFLLNTLKITNIEKDSFLSTMQFNPSDLKSSNFRIISN
jgi:hypothetical protein